MKQLVSFILILGLASSCMMGVVGNGKVEEQNRNIEEFNSISASGMVEIHLRQGETHQLKLVADENLHELIETEVRKGTLYISSRENIRKAKELDFYITTPTINKLDLSGAVEVDTKGIIRTSSMNIESSGAAEVSMDIEAESIVMGLSGASKIVLNGMADQVRVGASGASEIEMLELRAREVSLSLSGASEISTHVTEKLSIGASGAADVRYRGNPSISKDISGAADIRKVD